LWDDSYDDAIYDQPEPPYADRRVPTCRLRSAIPPKENCILTDASEMVHHIIVCTGNYDLFKFVCTLRASHLSDREIRPILLLCHRAPNPTEYRYLAVFKSVFFMVGNYKRQGTMISAGVKGCDKVVVINISAAEDHPMTEDEPENEFIDSSPIMINHLIYNMFHRDAEPKINIVEMEKRQHMRFLRPTGRSNKRRKSMQEEGSMNSSVEEYMYAPIYASGRVVVAAMLETALFQAYYNPCIIDIVQVLCGIRHQV
jgi:hypothetical protein